MSWFDATKFSKYAKTALKHAQKNIDKVLDIKDDDDDGNASSTITNIDIPSNANHLTTSESTTGVTKEADTFFDSFLGNELKSQVSNYISPEPSNVLTPSVDVTSNHDVEATPSKRRGKLRDQKSVQKDTTEHDTTVGQDVNRSSLPASIECEFVGLDNISNASDTEIVSNHYRSNISDSSKDHIFDDIDLSDSDTNISCSNISDISDDFSIHEVRINSSLGNRTELSDVVVDDITNITLDNTKATEKGISFLLGVDVEFETTDIFVYEDIHSPVKCDKVIDNENNICEIKPEEFSRNNEILVTTAEKTAESNNDPKDSDVDIVKTEELLIDDTHYCSDSELLNKSTYNNVEEYASNNDTHEDIEKFNDELSNASCIENSETVSCTDKKLKIEPITNDLAGKCIGMVGELPETLNEDNPLVNLNEEILTEQNCELKPSDSDTGFFQDDKIDLLVLNEVLSDLSEEYTGNEVKNDLDPCTNVNKEFKDDETEEASDKCNIELNIKSFSTDSTTSDVASIQNEVGGSKCIESEDSLVHIDAISKSDHSSLSSSLCVIEEPGSDPLESLMKQTESILITPAVSVVDDIDFLQQKINTQENISDIEKNNISVLKDTIEKADLQYDPSKNDISQGQFLETNQLNEKIATLNEEIKELHNVIDARETKIMELCKQNISFEESISVYQNQINQLEQVNQGDDEEMENIRQEFTKRIAECDVKCQAAIKERDYCKAKLIETEASIRQSANEQVSVLTNSLLEKEETIQDLLNEGEALSKKELERNTHIKKLRVKLKDATTKNTSLTEQGTGFESEIQKLKEVIIEKENNEKKLEGELKKLEGITDSQEDEVSTLKETLDDMEEKYRAMESTLKNTYSEINRLNLENAQKDSEVQEASHAFDQRKVLEEKLKDLEKTSKVGKEELLIQLEDLQLAYSRLEHQLGRREDELKKEIEDLHNRLEHAMYRNQELSQSVSLATKPLLRQIENLQSTYAVQSEGWECVEKSLNDRLISLQDQLALAVEKERVASEVAIEASSKLKAIRTQEGVLRGEKTNLQISLDNESNKCKDIESEWKREKSSYETKLSKLKVVVLELEGEKRVLEEQLTAERIRYENDTLRMSTQLTLQQHQSQSQSSRHSSRTSSISGDISDNASPQKMSSSDTPLGRYLSHSSSCHEGFQKGTVTTTAASIEHLKSQLRSREGEVFVLHEQIKELEKTKSSLARELVNLANRVEELECSNEDFDTLKEEHSNLKSRYNAVLQMYGEKAEEAEELKMDIEDVKNMYRQQIQELCGGNR